MPEPVVLPSTYPALLEEISSRISTSQLRAALSVSRELVLLYWSIGHEILVGRRPRAGEPGSSIGWAIICRPVFLASRVQPAQSQIYAQSGRAWPDREIVPQRVALLPGAISGCCSTGSRSHPFANGTSGLRSNTGGAGTSLLIWSPADCMSGKGRR